MRQSIRKIQQQQGFTLVEMLVYFGVLTIFLFVMTTMFTNILDMQLDSEADSNVANDARYIYERLAYDINRSESIVSPSQIGSSSAMLQLLIDGSPVTYSVQNGILQAQTGSDTVNLNGFDTTTSAVSFTRVGNISGTSGVSLDLTVVGKTQKQSGTSSKEIQTMIGER
jgi:type II secretory pathway pseudopilin PulG